MALAAIRNWQFLCQVILTMAFFFFRHKNCNLRSWVVLCEVPMDKAHLRLKYQVEFWIQVSRILALVRSLWAIRNSRN